MPRKKQLPFTLSTFFNQLHFSPLTHTLKFSFVTCVTWRFITTHRIQLHQTYKRKNKSPYIHHTRHERMRYCRSLLHPRGPPAGIERDLLTLPARVGMVCCGRRLCRWHVPTTGTTIHRRCRDTSAVSWYNRFEALILFDFPVTNSTNPNTT